MSTLNDWLTTFGNLTFHPYPRVFLEESKKASGKLPSTVAWLVITVILMNASLYVTLGRTYPIFRILLSIIVIPIVFLIFIFFLDTFARRLFHKRKEIYSQLLYTVAASFIPFWLIGIFASLIPHIGMYIGNFFLIYPLIPTTIACKTVTGLKLWQTALVVFISLVLTGMFMLCLPALLLSFMNAVPGTF